MRELKFRAWDKAKKKMIFTDNPFHAQIIASKIAGVSTCGYDIEIMQYTGLKDKNGHEAYEGDIFVDLTDGYCWSIAYMDGYYCAISGDETLMLHEFLENGKLDAEIIGNIYENPRLLEGRT